TDFSFAEMIAIEQTANLAFGPHCAAAMSAARNLRFPVHPGVIQHEHDPMTERRKRVREREAPGDVPSPVLRTRRHPERPSRASHAPLRAAAARSAETERHQR